MRVTAVAVEGAVEDEGEAEDEGKAAAQVHPYLLMKRMLLLAVPELAHQEGPGDQPLLQVHLSRQSPHPVEPS